MLIVNMKKLLALLLLFGIVGCSTQNDITQNDIIDVKYFECIRESSKSDSPVFIKIDTKEQYIKLLGLGILFDKEWSDNDLWITAKYYSLSINSKFSFNQLSGDASLTVGKDIDEYSGCKAIEPLLD